MKIGERALDTAQPEDLDGKVRELTGYSAAAMHGLLAAGFVLAGTVARALQPFLADVEDLAELARHIADAGVADVQAAVAGLYAEALGVAEPDAPAPAAAAAKKGASASKKGGRADAKASG